MLLNAGPTNLTKTSMLPPRMGPKSQCNLWVAQQILLHRLDQGKTNKEAEHAMAAYRDDAKAAHRRQTGLPATGTTLPFCLNFGSRPTARPICGSKCIYCSEQFSLDEWDLQDICMHRGFSKVVNVERATPWARPGLFCITGAVRAGTMNSIAIKLRIESRRAI